MTYLSWETVPGSRASRAEGSLAICGRASSRNEQISSVCRPVAGQMEIVAYRNAQFPQIRNLFTWQVNTVSTLECPNLSSLLSCLIQEWTSSTQLIQLTSCSSNKHNITYSFMQSRIHSVYLNGDIFFALAYEYVDIRKFGLVTVELHNSSHWVLHTI